MPKGRGDFRYIVMQNVPIQPSGQLCVNVTLPFQTELNEMGVLYFEARNPKAADVEYYVSSPGMHIQELVLTQRQCSDVRSNDAEALPEEHPAMCAAENETLIPMPDEYL